MAAPVHGQSITRGTAEGTVRDGVGAPLAGIRVVVTEVTTGVSWPTSTNASGSFRLSLLPPGDYDLFVEELGYQPKRIQGVPIRPGHRQQLTVTLELVELPVDEVDVVHFRSPAAASRPDASQWFSPFEMADLPENRRELSELGRLSTAANEELGTEGLPGWLSGLVVDGIRYEAARHPDLPTGWLGAAVFPLSAFSAAELITNGLDVEWSGAAGGYLSGYSRAGTARPQVRLLGDWTGGAAMSSDHFIPRDVGGHSFRGGALLSGPVIRDTAHFVLGIEGHRLEVPAPPLSEIDSLEAGLLETADGFGTDLAPYTVPRIVKSELISAFGHFDWQIADAHAFSVRGSFSALEGSGGGKALGLEPDHIASLGSEVEGLDISGAASLASRLGSFISQEFRVGLERSKREYRGSPLTGTRIVDGGRAFGRDPTVPGEFEHFALRTSETLHFVSGRHRLKFGLGGLYASHEQRYVHARLGEFTFAGAGELAGLEGTFAQTVGSPPFATFRNWQLSAYLQHMWLATPRLEVLVGLRYDYERLDRDKVRWNEAWLERSGLDNTEFDRGLSKLSPRFGFRWDVGQRGEWLVGGGAGIYHDLVGPGTFGELVTLDGAVEFRRGVGTLDAWPEVPDLQSAPVLGPRLTLLGPDFQPPRTSRASLGVTRLFPNRTAVHLSGSYRYTDHLPRRRDLNLPLAPATRDQHGRPIYGTLVKQGSLLTVQPGSNRRFDDFDLVSALNADGVSSYWGLTLAAERHTGGWLDLLASYTFSWTNDDWLTGRGGGPEAQLTPFPDSLNGEDWADDTSDFDVPHRLVVGAELRFPTALAGARLAALYRFESGRPFTPGFRDGVDVNGDGSGRNDPAFVDPNVLGMETLLQEWDCLADKVGGFAERNSCRAPNVHRLDLRFAIGLYRLQGLPVEIVIDALNLFDADTGLPDRALFLIDRDGTLETNADGTLTLPLVVNPHFGEWLLRQASGRSFRFGVRIGL